MEEFIPACTIRKEIRNSPVKAIVYFLPREERKNCFQVISEG
jgi:hypothetical protein